MRVLVTGSEGFIGKHLVAALLARGDEVVGIDRANGTDILRCDLPDADRVFHLAAQTDAYSRDAMGDAMTNIIGSLRIFERYGSKVTFASSAMVNYPQNFYAVGKSAAEHYARLFGAGIVRFCNITGHGGHSVMEKFAAADELTIYGTGEQRRHYADVSEAVRALIDCEAGEMTVLSGEELTVNQIADRFPKKSRRYLPAKVGDMIDGRQLAA